MNTTNSTRPPVDLSAWPTPAELLRGPSRRPVWPVVLVAVAVIAALVMLIVW